MRPSSSPRVSGELPRRQQVTERDKRKRLSSLEPKTTPNERGSARSDARNGCTRTRSGHRGTSRRRDPAVSLRETKTDRRMARSRRQRQKRLGLGDGGRNFAVFGLKVDGVGQLEIAIPSVVCRSIQEEAFLALVRTGPSAAP